MHQGGLEFHWRDSDKYLWGLLSHWSDLDILPEGLKFH